MTSSWFAKRSLLILFFFFFFKDHLRINFNVIHTLQGTQIIEQSSVPCLFNQIIIIIKIQQSACFPLQLAYLYIVQAKAAQTHTAWQLQMTVKQTANYLTDERVRVHLNLKKVLKENYHYWIIELDPRFTVVNLYTTSVQKTTQTAVCFFLVSDATCSWQPWHLTGIQNNAFCMAW